jgi:hypothetical protein
MYASGKSQPLHEKVEALKTLLPLVWVHLSRMREARCVGTYGASEVVPGPPPPGWSVLDCDGRCHRCEWEKTCGGEWWEIEMRILERQYHVQKVARAWLRLEALYPRMAAAVYDAHCEEPDRTIRVVQSERSRRRRANLEKAGLQWMARYIRVDLTPFYDKPRSTEEKVRELLVQGVRSTFVIACRVGVSDRHVRRIRAVLEAAEGGQKTLRVDRLSDIE